MINAFKLAGILNGKHIADIFDNAKGCMVAFRIGANATGFTVRNIIANLAVFYLTPEFQNGFA